MSDSVAFHALLAVVVICYLAHGAFAVEAWSLYREEARDHVHGWDETKRWAARITLLWPLAPLVVVAAGLYGLIWLARTARRRP